MTDPALPIAVAFIAAREGFRSEPYRDSGGVYTIGYGFTVNADGSRVTAATSPITQEAAYARLGGLVSRVLASVRVMVCVPLSLHATAALASFAFNAGTNALRNSTLLRLLNQGDMQGAAEQFGSWVYDDQKVCPGLVARRKLEKMLFLTPDTLNKTAVPLKVTTPASTVVASADDLNAAVLASLHPSPE